MKRIAIKKNERCTIPFAHRMVKDLVDRIPINESGTCNPQDPTAYSKGEREFGFIPYNYMIKITNFWGTKIEIYRVPVGEVIYPLYTEEHLVADLYLDFCGYGKYELHVWQSFEGMWKLIHFFNKMNKVWIDPHQEEDYFEDPMGCLADYI